MTLTEVLVVLGLVTFMFAIGSVTSLEELRSSSYRSDQDILIDALLYTRSKAQSGGCQAEECGRAVHQGLHISSDSFTVFEGTSYASRDTRIDLTFQRSSDVTLSGETDIIFLSGSGYVPAPAHIFFGPPSRLVVSIAENGKITTSLDL